MRVVHILGRLSKGGGVQTVVRQLADAIDPSEVELHLVSVRPRIEADAIEDVPLAFHPVTDHRGEFGFVAEVRMLVKIASVVRHLRPDVVQVHSGAVKLGAIASLMSPRVPFVLEVHDAPGSGRHGRWTDVAEGLWARARRSTVVSHSRSVASEIEQRWSIRPDRRAVFPLAVDAEHFVSGPAVRDGRDGIGDDDFVLVVIGRLVQSKRFDLAIESVRALRERQVPAKLLIVGDGPEREPLRLHAEAAGVADHVVLLGARFDGDLVHTLRVADVLVSTASYEGFGLTIVEAMAVGRPTVVMDVGGVGDIVVPGVTGELVAFGDVSAMTDALVDLHADPARREQMGRSGRARVEEQFVPSALARSFTDVYRTASTGRSRT